MVSGKRPARAIGTVHPWRESDNKKARVGIAKRSDRAAVIIGVALLYFIKKSRQARTCTTIKIEYRIAHRTLIVHMTNDRLAKSFGTNQRCAWN